MSIEWTESDEELDEGYLEIEGVRGKISAVIGHYTCNNNYRLVVRSDNERINSSTHGMNLEKVKRVAEAIIAILEEEE